MENPWAEFSMAEPYVAPGDALALNSRRYTNERQSLQLHVLPEPYIGRVKSPIVLLKLNPGFTPNDILFTNDPVARELWQANLLHQDMEYPFYALNPEISWAENFGWWKKKIHFLTDIIPRNVVAEHVVCIEFLPYHSYGKPSLNNLLPSQLYNFYLVNEAIERGALIFLGNTVDM